MIVNSTSPLGQLLGRFELNLPKAAGSIAVLEFKVLTPDSFLWRLLIGKTVYYLSNRYFMSFCQFLVSECQKSVCSCFVIDPRGAE